jgi:hypothetical protein
MAKNCLPVTYTYHLTYKFPPRPELHKCFPHPEVDRQNFLAITVHTSKYTHTGLLGL